MAALSRIGGRALAGLLPDLTTMPGPVYAALARAITALVLDGRVAVSTRLPSERELAAALRLSRATVSTAYDRLRQDGYLASRTGSGSFVTVPEGSGVRASTARWAPSGAPSGPEDMIDLSCATLAAPPGLVEAAAADAAGRLTAATCSDGYTPYGLDGLRQAIADRYTERGAPTRIEQILITNGAVHAVDLVLRLLTGPGDRVLTELPTYPGALDVIAHNRGRPVPVPLAADGGWNVDRMTSTLRQSASRLAYLMPDFQNPTGALVDDDARRAVLRAARETATTVVVDESFVELGFGTDPVRPTAAHDPSVISIGSLSKIVWAGLRVGWVRAPADLVSRLAALRASVDMGGAVLDQLIATDLVGGLTAVGAARVAELRPRYDALAGAVAEHVPGWRLSRPDGGLSTWVELDAPLSTALSMLALPAGVIVLAGPRFGVDGTLERFVRLPFALPAPQLHEAVHRLAQVWDGLSASDAAEARRATARSLVVA